MRMETCKKARCDLMANDLNLEIFVPILMGIM